MTRGLQVLGGGGGGAGQAPGRQGRAQRSGDGCDDLQDLAVLPAEEAERWRRIITCAAPICRAPWSLQKGMPSDL